MNKAQKQIELAKLADEQRQLNVLKAIYKKAVEDVNKNLKITNGKIEVLLSDLDNLDEGTRSVLQSQIYHKNFQEGISRQLNGFLNDLNSKQYKSIDEYLNACYETGFVGAAYELADQGIPLIMPIDQKKVVKAVKLDSKISKPLYTKLGEDVDVLKKRIANNISRGIAFSDSYENIARNIRNDSNVSFNKAMRIVRTEGHRVNIESAFDAMKEAQSKGADIVKQWNAQLDGKTRPHHRQLDGQIRELDEPFELNGIKVMYPSAFGRPEEDINCRCVIHQRARWALDEEELEALKERASFHGLRVNDSKAFGQEKAKDFADFKKKYLIAAKKMAVTLANTGGSSKIVAGAVSGARNPFGTEAEAHAKRYYGLVRSMSTDVAKIAQVTGIPEKDVQAIKNYIFMEKHDLGNGTLEYFAPDYMMAESWRRLSNGNPEPHDITLLKHEIMEKELMEKGMSQYEAHIKTSAKYDYDGEARRYYAEIKKHKKK